MSKRRKNTPIAAVVEATADYGPGWRRDGGRVVQALPIANAFELADIADAARPDTLHTVRVARRRDPLLTILNIRRKDGPDRAYYLAAERFRDDCALADGARNQGDSAKVDCQPIGVGVSISQIEAQTRARVAWLAIRGHENATQVADVVRLVVLGNFSLTAVEEARRAKRGEARGLLATGLGRLDEHYAGMGVGR